MISDGTVIVCARYGGPKAEQWAIRAQRYPIRNQTTARLAYLCLNRALFAALEYQPNLPNSVRETTMWIKHPYTDEIVREDPMNIVGRTVASEKQAIEDMARRRGLGDVTRWSSRWISEDVVQRCKYRHWIRRQPAKVRKSIRKRERIIASIRAEAAVDWWRHPFANTLQEQDDREARMVRDRVY